MKIRQILSKALSPKPDQPAHKKPSDGPPTYALVESAQLGEGGYGKVYEATVNGDPARRVAVKKIALSRVREESLHREVRRLEPSLAPAPAAPHAHVPTPRIRALAHRLSPHPARPPRPRRFASAASSTTRTSRASSIRTPPARTSTW
jgi:serine/threonine protein kinase